MLLFVPWLPTGKPFHALSCDRQLHGGRELMHVCTLWHASCTRTVRHARRELNVKFIEEVRPGAALAHILCYTVAAGLAGTYFKQGMRGVVARRCTQGA